MYQTTYLNQAIILVHEALTDASFQAAESRDEKLAVLYMREADKNLKRAKAHLECAHMRKEAVA